jgi:wyosine [tRNA(Phe)-imidazoG37] synthetase (radical SAM superfamily)
MALDGKCPSIYGPMKSRRQGYSLGINLGDTEMKCCTFSCVYCQAGYGRKMDGVPRFPELTDVLRALAKALEEHRNKLDSVTMAGNSEPTAYPKFKELVDAILEMKRSSKSRWIFNCLSNGSELDRAEVREACDRLDEAWIKIDCGTDALFGKLSRPLARIGTVADHVARIAKLRTPRIQTLLWHDSEKERGLTNYTPENLEALLKAYEKIKPHTVHITTVQRATATAGLMPATREELSAFAERARKVAENVLVFP